MSVQNFSFLDRLEVAENNNINNNAILKQLCFEQIVFSPARYFLGENETVYRNAERGLLKILSENKYQIQEIPAHGP